MPYEMYDPTENDLDFTIHRELENMKNMDKKHSKVYKQTVRSDGTLKRTKVDIYFSGGCNTHIRDAESGRYYSDLVGSANEDLYYKVSLSTGEHSGNSGYNTLYYLSPEHCESHLGLEIDQQSVANWLEKKQFRMQSVNSSKVFRS